MVCRRRAGQRSPRSAAPVGASLSVRRRLWWERVRLAQEVLALLRRLMSDADLGAHDFLGPLALAATGLQRR